MIRGENPLNEPQTTQNTLTIKDFVMGERIRKVTTHELFQLTKNNQVYVAKLFQPQFHHNYQQELNILRQLNHQNIVSLVYSQPAENETMGLWSCDMLVLKWAEHGSLNEYIPMNGRLTEPVARVIFKEMLCGLKYAANHQPNGFIHPNLMPSSVLLDSQRHVKLCGWSGQPQKKDKKDLVKDLLFCCCEILILMVTGYMPFFKKDPKVDPLYRYLKPEYINKFWQIFQKRIASKHKSFQFDKNLKQLLQKVFLQQWTTFQQVQNSAWVIQSSISYQQFTKHLSTLEAQSKQRRTSSLQKQLQKSQQKRKLILQYEQQTLRGSSSRSSGEFDFFIQDFYDSFYTKQDVPASQCSELIRVFDERPNFVIATLKEHLRHMEEHQDADSLFGGDFQLKNYELEKDGNLVYIKLHFSQVHEESLDPEEDVLIKVSAIIKFFKNNKNNLYAEVKIMESNLSQFYASQMMRFIQDKVRGYEE